jgi:virginiamycin B lyase
MKKYQKAISLGIFAVVLLVTSAKAQVSAVNYFQTPLDYSYGVAAGPDGAIWSAGWGSSTGNAVARTTVAGETTVYPITFTGSSRPGTGLSVGPDGAMWFVDTGTKSIGRICVNVSVTCELVGDVSEYPLPPLDTLPTSMVAGGDGGMWFAAGSIIGRVNTASASLGSITTHPIKSGNAAQEITAGPGATLWFTEPWGNAIGRVTTTPIVLTEFPVPYPSTFPWSITTGTDAALWFTGQQSQTLVRLTTSLSWSAYTSPVPSPSEITPGPDGSLWFLGTQCSFYCNYWVGRMTPSGEGSSVGLTNYPSYITSGPDGAVWVSSVGGTEWIAQVVPTLRRNGIDLSDSAGALSAATVSNFLQAGIQYAVVKAPQDGGIASDQIEALLSGGISTAAYCFLHFQTTSPSGTDQANACLNTIQNDIPNISFMAIDVEETAGNLATLQTRLAIIADALKAIARRDVKPVIYTMSSDWATLTGGSNAFSQYELWNAASGAFEGYADPAGNLVCETGQTQQIIDSSITPMPRGGRGIPSLYEFAQFGGWTFQQGIQYDIAGGIPPKAACLFGVQVDFDVFSPTVFEKIAGASVSTQ